MSRRSDPRLRPLLRRGRRRAALAAVVLAAACATTQAPPQGRPSGREGWLVYTVGALRFEAPSTWTPSGDPRHLKLGARDGAARLEVSTPEQPFASEAACLQSAEEVMKRGEVLERSRRHPTKFAGVRALTLEGDQGGWHVWAWAACDGPVQYQVFFTARTPAPAEALEAYRALTASARIGGEV
jgi:hypothetical protein